MAEKTIKFIKTEDGPLRIDFEALANKPIIKDSELNIDGEGILYIEGTKGETFTGDTSDIIDMINMLHYYGNKDIIPSYQGITIIPSDSNDNINIDGSLCKNGILIIPYSYTITNKLSYPNYNIDNGELITKIIIPRNADVDFYYEDKFSEGIRYTWSDDTFLEHFPNLETIVRIHEDGAVLSYNLKTGSLN